jgi:hypothetical protein
LSYGIKNLYQDTKDISELRKELVIINYCLICLVQRAAEEPGGHGVVCVEAAAGD